MVECNPDRLRPSLSHWLKPFGAAAISAVIAHHLIAEQLSDNQPSFIMEGWLEGCSSLSQALFCLLLSLLVWFHRDALVKSARSFSQYFVRAMDSLPSSRVDTSMFFSRHNRKSSLGLMTNGNGPHTRTLTLSVPDSFLSKQKIATMTLRDISDIFSYVSKSSQAGFDREAFFRSTPCRPPVKHAIHAMDCAVLCSRGPNTVLYESRSNSSDEMDALTFCAAVRIYAEWRSLRGIPEGYPKFGFGMNMARRDLIQNLGKIEQAVHDMLDTQQKQLDEAHNSHCEEEKKDISVTATPYVRLTCPTLRQLLQHEIDSQQLHPSLPKVFEHSAGSGVLWTVRQICYQSSTLENNTRIPVDFPTPKAAFHAAYESVYGKYHGFLTRTMFQSTIDAAPPSDVVTQHMNAPYILEAEEEQNASEERSAMEAIVSNDEDDEVSDVIEEEEINSNTTPRPRIASQDVEGGFEENGAELGDKIAQIFSAVFAPCLVAGDDETHEEQERNLMSSVHASLSSKAAEMAMERNDVPYYLSILRPMEQGWDLMIKDLNMNDPSRV